MGNKWKIQKARRELNKIIKKCKNDPDVILALKNLREAELNARRKYLFEFSAARRNINDFTLNRERYKRWSKNTPLNIIQRCKNYWIGTRHLNTYRIHCWNDKGIITSFPGSYWTDEMFKQHYNKATVYCISLTETDESGKPKTLFVNTNISKSQHEKILEESTK